MSTEDSGDYKRIISALEQARHEKRDIPPAEALQRRTPVINPKNQVERPNTDFPVVTAEDQQAHELRNTSK